MGGGGGGGVGGGSWGGGGNICFFLKNISHETLTFFLTQSSVVGGSKFL